ncbi:MAG: rRNA maturation RNase YbeY, partial [Candidatus Cloacimonadales bacterium]|nr:rRNA maturation RNase YbeY [Candidatus Cloacimonadales bacterium]
MNTQNNSENPENPGGNKSVILDNQSEIDIEDNLFESLFEFVIQQEGHPEDTFVNLVLVCDGFIKQYNRQYLGRDELTDVISFSAEVPGIHFLGDIIIDTKVAEKQKENRTIGEELQILFLHGLLHLLGY